MTNNIRPKIYIAALCIFQDNAKFVEWKQWTDIPSIKKAITLLKKKRKTTDDIVS